MWKALEDSGLWVGKIWNMTKTEDLIPLHQSIIKIPGSDRNYRFACIGIDLTESKLLDQKIYELAYIDSHSNLKNKNALLEFQEEAKNISIILLRLSNYKNIHLRFGSSISNRMFLKVLLNVQSYKPHYDLYRYDENTLAFVIGSSSDQNLSTLTDSLLAFANEPIEIDKILLNPIISIGVSTASINENIILSRALFEAESALRYAESRKYSFIAHFNDIIESEMLESFDFRNAVTQATENGDFTVHFQPIIDTYTGELFSFEALARWNIDGEYISPSRFIPEAENSNAIYSLGLQILEQSCECVLKWKSYHSQLKLNVNVSLLQLENGKFVEALEKIIIKTKFPPSDLILEITESISIQNSEVILNTIESISNLGITLALDDFGTGFSSIQRLKNMPISIVKIDHGFIKNIDESIDDTSVITGMISLSHKIGLDVIAEGVENIDQLQILKNRNCRYVQGYLFSKPMSIQDSEHYVKTYDSKIIFNNTIVLDLENYESIEDTRFHNNEILGSCIFDLDGIIIDSNRNFSSIVGERKSELIGESINSFIKSDLNDFIYDTRIESNIIEASGFIQRIDGTTRYVIYSLINELDKRSSQSFIRCFIEDITDNLNDELKLLRVRQGYERIFHNAPAMIITWNQDYEIIEWNQSAMNTFKLSIDEVKDQSIFDTIVPESEIRTWRQFVDQAIGGSSNIVKLKAQDRDGEIHICECHNDIVKNSAGEIDFIITIMKDITEETKAQAQSSSLLSIIDNGPALVFMCDSKGNVLYKSKACMDIEQLRSTNQIDSLKIKYYNHLDNEIEVPDRSKIDMWTSTGSLEVSENDVRRVRVTIFKDEVTELQRKLFVYIFMDYTKEYDNVQSISHLKNIIVDQERLAELGHLSAGIAHEINNPLSYMISSSDILRTELQDMYKIVQTTDDDAFKYLSTDIDEILNEFDEGLERIKTIVTGLRSYSWAGQTDEYVPFDLNKTIEKVLTIAHNEIKYTANVSLNLAELPMIEAIGSKISQVILNLIINASHAIEKKDLSDMGTINITTAHDSLYVYCVIEDSGIGMPEDVQDHIFEAFFTTKPEGVGTGLGLSISKEIIQDLHHGSITVDSVMEKGTKFTIALPLSQPRAPES